jgi:hypothetical protein
MSTETERRFADDGDRDYDILTVEMTYKWYHLWLLPAGGGEPRKVHFSELPEKIGVSSYVDHCPNPTAFDRWALDHGALVGILAQELVVGRWVTEVLDEFCDEGAEYSDGWVYVNERFDGVNATLRGEPNA